MFEGGNMTVSLIYVTTGSKEDAVSIGKELVTSKLVACVNIIEKMHSIYFWKGELQNDQEAILIAKTKTALVPEVIEKVKSRHRYEIPCILSLPVTDGNPVFLDWIAGEVK